MAESGNGPEDPGGWRAREAVDSPRCVRVVRVGPVHTSGAGWTPGGCAGLCCLRGGGHRPGALLRAAESRSARLAAGGLPDLGSCWCGAVSPHLLKPTGSSG
jgi:hypothetical protein